MNKDDTNVIPFQYSNNLSHDKTERIVVLSGTVSHKNEYFESINSKDITELLNTADEEKIRIKLNSGGGDVFEGIEIYNALKNSNKNIVVEVTALAASAASLIAMGANELIMNVGSNLMIHEASTFSYGNKSDIQKTLNALENIDKSIVSIYKEKTGLDETVLNDMIAKETWFTADEATEKGFADSVGTVEEPKEEEPENDELVNSIVEKVLNKIETKQKDNEKEIKNIGLSRFAFK